MWFNRGSDSGLINPGLEPGFFMARPEAEDFRYQDKPRGFPQLIRRFEIRFAIVPSDARGAIWGKPDILVLSDAVASDAFDGFDGGEGQSASAR
jgi:hypothetical protein